MRMRAAVFDRFGGPELIHVATVPVPEPEESEILVEVMAAGVGSWDPDLVSGRLNDADPRFPKTIGSDGAGVVRATGRRAKKFKIGDRVYGWGFGNPKGGFFAEYAVLSQDNAALIPENLSFEEAGVLAVDGLTALEGIEKALIKRGHRVMIFGTNGGAGHLAVQLAKKLKAQVFAIAAGADGVKLAAELGADAFEEGHDEHLTRRLSNFAAQYDAALVFAGGNGWLNELKLVRPRGYVVHPNGVEPIPRAQKSTRLRAYDGFATAEEFERLNKLIGKEPFKVVVSKTYALEDVSQALADVQRHHLGKLAVQVKA